MAVVGLKQCKTAHSNLSGVTTECGYIVLDPSQGESFYTKHNQKTPNGWVQSHVRSCKPKFPIFEALISFPARNPNADLYFNSTAILE